MMDRNQTRNELLNALAEILDPVLAARQFQRPKRSFQYRRRYQEALQWVNLHWNRPRYSDDLSAAHVAPWLLVYLEPVTRLAANMVADPQWFSPDRKVTVALPFGRLRPARTWVCWSPADVPGIRQSIRDLGEYYLRHGEPFLEQYATVEGLVRGYESDDYRLSLDDELTINLAAAYVLRGETAKARGCLERRFAGKAGPMRIYRRAFEYLDDLERG